MLGTRKDHSRLVGFVRRLERADQRSKAIASAQGVATSGQQRCRCKVKRRCIAGGKQGKLR